MQFRPRGSDCYEAFDPEDIAILEVAFDRAWSFVKASGEGSFMSDEAAQACIAVHIIALSRQGEKNVLRLANLAIGRFRAERAPAA